MIDVYWLTRPGSDTCARCRWDEMFVEDIICGTTKRVAGSPQIRHHMSPPTGAQDYGVVVFPAGAHEHRDSKWLNSLLREFRRVQVFISSDESSTFPIGSLYHRDMQLWVMTPRAELHYPKRTIFIGEGPGERVVPGIAPKTRSWFLSGQNTHSKRNEAFDALRDLPGGWCHPTEGFQQGLDRGTYLRALEETRIAPCPTGPTTQDSFRFFEALERGCVPVVDELRPDGGGAGYWRVLGVPEDVAPRVKHWSEFAAIRQRIEDDWPAAAVRSHAWWHAERRRLNKKFVDHIRGPQGTEVRDRMTVLIPTSPIPSHPRPNIIVKTIQSIRERTDAEILIMCDGVREEQRDRSEDYASYLRTLLQLCERYDNVTPIVYGEHLHQAEMLRRTLELVNSTFLLYVEHDTPLEGDIPFDEILAEMDAASLNLMRFSHESEILDVHKHLTFADKVYGDHAPYVRTLQWSQRPHIAHRHMYGRILQDFFHPSARTMIEDVMHGITENSAVTEGELGWRAWKMGIYHPEGGIRRSHHLDGRETEDKYPMRFAYPNGRIPDGAPRPE